MQDLCRKPTGYAHRCLQLLRKAVRKYVQVAEATSPKERQDDPSTITMFETDFLLKMVNHTPGIFSAQWNTEHAIFHLSWNSTEGGSPLDEEHVGDYHPSLRKSEVGWGI